jgi:hypothetical protein
MLAVDFFHVDCALTLKRGYVFFALEVRSRYVHRLGGGVHEYVQVAWRDGFSAPTGLDRRLRPLDQQARHTQAELRRQLQDPQARLPTERCLTRH